MKMTSEQTKLVKSDMSLLTRNQRDKNNISIRFAELEIETAECSVYQVL